MYENSPTEYSSFILVLGEGVTFSTRVREYLQGFDSEGNLVFSKLLVELDKTGEILLSEINQPPVARFTAIIRSGYVATVNGNVITINKQ